MLEILYRKFTSTLGCLIHFLAISISPTSYLFLLFNLFLTHLLNFGILC